MSATMTNREHKQRRKVRKMLNRTCPEHGVPLVHSSTKYGGRWGCTEPGCTVCCWEGSTSTPANEETRALRMRCHAAFDPLWRNANGGFGTGDRRHRRTRAYSWLANRMKVQPHLAHIGMFDADQCRTLLAEIEALLHDREEADGV